MSKQVFVTILLPEESLETKFRKCAKWNQRELKSAELAVTQADKEWKHKHSSLHWNLFAKIYGSLHCLLIRNCSFSYADLPLPSFLYQSGQISWGHGHLMKWHSGEILERSEIWQVYLIFIRTGVHSVITGNLKRHKYAQILWEDIFDFRYAAEKMLALNLEDNLQHYLKIKDTEQQDHGEHSATWKENKTMKGTAACSFQEFVHPSKF